MRVAHIHEKAIHRPVYYPLSALSVRLCDDHFYTMPKLYGNAESILFDEHGRTRQARYHFKEGRL
jgi:hypothetical protein